MRHFLSLTDVERGRVEALLAEAARLKAESKAVVPPRPPAASLGLVFEKQSRCAPGPASRGRWPNWAAVRSSSATDGHGERESVPDFACTLSSYTDVVALRTFKHETIEESFATRECRSSTACPTVHLPALGDLLTIQETFGKLEGKTLVFVGDGNNVARSVAVGCGLFGLKFILAAPEGYGFDERFLQKYRKLVPGGQIQVNGRLEHAVGEADVIYTDVWTSMGQEAEREERRKQFALLQVNERRWRRPRRTPG
ncbi:MAG: ornithine carbamoyltransferase [Gemmataceae bacterium]